MMACFFLKFGFLNGSVSGSAVKYGFISANLFANSYLINELMTNMRKIRRNTYIVTHIDDY